MSYVKKRSIKGMAVLLMFAGFGSMTSAQEDLSLISSDEVHTFLIEPMCSRDRMQMHYMDFIGQHIPPLVLSTSKTEWTEQSEKIRENVLSEVFLKNVPEKWLSEPLKVEWIDIIEKKDYIIHKLRYECLPSLSIPALLYVPKNLTGKVPVVLNVNGHSKEKGKGLVTKQIRCINQVKKGMIALNIDWVGHGELHLPGYRNHNNLAYLDLCGVSGVSVFYLTLKKGLDLLLQQEHADAERVAVTGLSGGGWQTIVISALDTRVSCSVPVAGYIGLLTRLAWNSDVGDLEQIPSDLCRYADYRHLTALLAPRPALLINNRFDPCCFKAYRTRPSIYSPVIPFYGLFGEEDNFQFYENIDPGTHNYGKDNREQLYQFLNDRFFDQKNHLMGKEIPVKNEILSEEETRVGIPKDNKTFNSLAVSQMTSLPLNKLPNGDKEGILRWQKSSREKLKDVIRFQPVEQIEEKSYKTLQIEDVQEQNDQKLTLTQIKYFINEHDGYREWEVPAVRITTEKSDPDKMALVISDKGREKTLPEVKKYVASGHTVIALDILLTGEQRHYFSNPSFGAMLLATVGERALGIAVSQLNAIIHLNKGKNITLIGKGRVCSIIALLTASLRDSDNIDTAELIGLPATLKQLIEDQVEYEACPELYCFELLRYFDIKEYIGMAAPANVIISDAMGGQEKIEKEFNPLQKFFKQYSTATVKVN